MHPINEMSVFTEVVQTGSFIEAGRRLGLTSSGVSKKISRFEDRLGVRLFNRTTRTLSLTEAGNALFERCENILAAIEDAEDTVRNLSTVPKGSYASQPLMRFRCKFWCHFSRHSPRIIQKTSTRYRIIFSFNMKLCSNG